MFDYLAAKKETDRPLRRSVALGLAALVHIGIVVAAVGVSSRPAPDGEGTPKINWPGPKPVRVSVIQPGQAHTAPARKPARAIQRLTKMPTKAPQQSPEPPKAAPLEEAIVTGPTSSTGTDDSPGGQGSCEGPNCSPDIGGPGGTGFGPGTREVEISFPHEGYTKPHLERADCLAESIHIPSELHGAASRVLVRFAVESNGAVSHFSFPQHVPDPRIEAAIVAGVRNCNWIAGTDPKGDPAAIWVVQPIRLE